MITGRLSLFLGFLIIAQHSCRATGGDNPTDSHPKAALELGFYPAFPKGDRLTADVLWKIAEGADRRIWHDKGRNFDLGLGPVTDEVRSPIDLKFEQIQQFLAQEKHKDLVVIHFDKSVMWNEKEFVRARADEVTKQMLKVGYKRVVILGAHSSGVHYVSDTHLEASGAEQEKR